MSLQKRYSSIMDDLWLRISVSHILWTSSSSSPSFLLSVEAAERSQLHGKCCVKPERYHSADSYIGFWLVTMIQSLFWKKSYIIQKNKLDIIWNSAIIIITQVPPADSFVYVFYSLLRIISSLSDCDICCLGHHIVVSALSWVSTLC